MVVERVHEITLPTGDKLVIEKEDDEDKSVIISLEDNNGKWIQDLAIVEEEWSEIESRDHTTIQNLFRVFVYGNPESDDCTAVFKVSRRKALHER